jgi:hypothetical protein
VQVERNEDYSVLQGLPTPIDHLVPLFHHHTLIRYDHHVSIFCMPLTFPMTHSKPRTHLSTVISVQVDEVTAKGWFRSLLSATHHIHSHGVVHNDIKYVMQFIDFLSHNSIPCFSDLPIYFSRMRTRQSSSISVLQKSTMSEHIVPFTAVCLMEHQKYAFLSFSVLMQFMNDNSILLPNVQMVCHTIHVKQTCGRWVSLSLKF